MAFVIATLWLVIFLLLFDITDSFHMPSELMKHCFVGVFCWEISAAVNVRTCSVKLAKWCDAATKAWHKIERYRESTSYPFLMWEAFHPHLTYS